MSGVETLMNSHESLLHARFPGLVEALSWAGAGIDFMAIVVMLIGAVRFLGGFVRAETGGAARLPLLDAARRDLGRYILTGLEIFIVSDIIGTALSLQLSDLVFLALLVAIRSVVSYFLEREITGLREGGTGAGGDGTAARVGRTP